MKTLQTIKTKIMKNFLMIILMISGVGFGQPIINQPTNYIVCDDNIIPDGIAPFDLSSKNSEILGSLSLSTHTISYHLTISDANFNLQSILQNPFINGITGMQSIFVRVTETATNLYSTTTFNLIVNPKPFNNSSNFVINDIGVFDGFESFDFNSKIPSILNGQSGNNVSFYLTEVNALADTNQLLANYTNISNPQTIYSKVINNISGCFTIKSFQLIVNNPLNVYIPDANFKAILVANTGINTNNDGEIQLTEAAIIPEVNVNNANISDLTGIKSFTSMTGLSCAANQLISLDLLGLNSLTYILCQNNQLTNIILPQVQGLNFLNCSSNNLSEINLSNFTGNDFNFTNNPNLKFINLKNGFINNCVYLAFPGAQCSFLGGLPSLEYICIDEGENINWAITQSGINIGNFCSFNPGGNFNTIIGKTKFDSQNDGCNNLDPILKNLKMSITGWGGTDYTFANNIGEYKYFTTFADQLVTPIFENPNYFNVAPISSLVSFPSTNNLTEVRDFCITANGIHDDFEVALVALDQPRPGFNCRYKCVYKNKGNQTLNKDIVFTFDDTKMSYVSANVPIYSQTANQIVFNYGNPLNPFEVRDVECIMKINAPTDVLPVNSGDIINTSLSIASFGDDFPADNVSNLSQIAINSFDPNDKTCIDGDDVNPSKIGEYLHYNINFENTGTASAVNVIVKDALDISKFDINSLQVIYASDDVRTDIKGNMVEFIFKNINLGASAVAGGPGGHGNVLFKIKTLPTLPIGTVVKNTAKIFFDYNFPIVTNEAKTTFANLSNTGFVIDNSVSIAPNPSNSKINITSKTEVKTMQLFDIQGRIIESYIGNKNVIDISDKTNGIYFLKINTDAGSKVEKIVKE